MNHAFYKSKSWEGTRRAYFQHAGGLCERCLERGKVTPGRIVHHKIKLTRSNVSDPNISLSFDNLQLLCAACHAEVHAADPDQGYSFDANGNLIPVPEQEPPR